MVQLRTKLRVVDNTGATLVSCIKIIGSSVQNNNVNLGTVLLVTIKRCKPRRKRVTQGGIRFAILVNCYRAFHRIMSNIRIRFSRNVVILVNRNLAPLGKRYRCPLIYEFCRKYPFLGSISDRIY